MFSVFSVFTQPQKNKFIGNLYQKELLWYFSEDIKMWPGTGCYATIATRNWLLCNIYVESMGLYTNVKYLIF